MLDSAYKSFSGGYYNCLQLTQPMPMQRLEEVFRWVNVGDPPTWPSLLLLSQGFGFVLPNGNELVAMHKQKTNRWCGHTLIFRKKLDASACTYLSFLRAAEKGDKRGYDIEFED